MATEAPPRPRPGDEPISTGARDDGMGDPDAGSARLGRATGAAPRTRARRVGAYAVLILLSALVLFPLYLTLLRTVSDPTAFVLAEFPRNLWLVEPEWGAFGQATAEADLWPAMGRSFIQTGLITASQVVTSILAAYAFTFLRFPFRRVAFGIFMGTLLLPLEVTLLANVNTMRQNDLINTMVGLVLPYGAFAFGTFLIRQAFLGIPSEIRDATRLDGHGHWTFLWRFAVPLSRPVIASFTVIAALGAWNQYLWPRAITTADDANTLQIALRSILAANPEEANVGVAGAVIAAVPVFILLMIFQRQIIRGLTAGAVKG